MEKKKALLQHNETQFALFPLQVMYIFNNT